MGASTLSFKRYVEQKFPVYARLFIYAVLEWVMIVLILLDGFLAYLANEFARFFELNIPCLLCTRIDYALSHRKPNLCYNDSICEAHKRDISSLAYCHAHKKLSEIRQMCESCLISFAMDKDSDRERFKWIMHKDTVDETNNEDKTVQRCSCCGDLLIKKPKYTRIPSLNSIAPAPSPRAWRSDLARGFDSPRSRFSDIKLISDNDSELPDEEDTSTAGGNKFSLFFEHAGRDDAKSEGIPEDACRTPSFLSRNKYFLLTDSAQYSPRMSRLSMETMNEGDGGDIVFRLKKQLRLDHKSLLALKLELDEERNASTIAANNAMAMITRLQDEKAALQMEALQYQRMMEEEVEFDQEEVQLMKDMLLKRDEEIRILVSEIDTYRHMYGPIQRVDGEAFEVHGDQDYQELRSHFFSSFDKSECASPEEADHYEHSGMCTAQDMEQHYESENSHLSGWLIEHNTSGYLDQESPLELNNVKQEDEDIQGN